MEIDDKYIEDFQKNYLEEFGEEISKEDAYERFSRLISLLNSSIASLGIIFYKSTI